MTTLQALRNLLDTSATTTLDEHKSFLKEAVFVSAQDDAYFVIAENDQFHAIVGAHYVNEKNEPISFCVNIIETFKHRDSAVLCALYYATNDAGHKDSSIEATVEAASYVEAY